MEHDAKLAVWSPKILGLLRIATGFLMIPHGTQKLFQWPISGPQGPAEPMTQAWFGGLIEAGLGLMFLLGVFTRPVAFILSGTMAVAYFQFHANQGFWPSENKGELAALYCFVFLYFVFSGAGAMSIDALFRKRQPLAEVP